MKHVLWTFPSGIAPSNSCLSDSIDTPVPHGPTGNQKILLSRSSGQYVHIGENGSLDGGGSSSSTAVFTMTFRDTYYEFESDVNTQLCLVMNVATENDEHYNNKCITIGNASTTVEEMTMFIERVSECHLCGLCT